MKERHYSVLLVSATDNFVEAVRPMLPSGQFDVKRTTGSNDARRESAQNNYDFIIINSVNRTENDIDFATDACTGPGCVVLVFVKNESYYPVYERVCEHGVFVLPKPFTKQAFNNAIRWMVSARERLRRTEKKTFSLENRMEEIRLINRAKWALINTRGMDEPGAHRYIEKQAMDRCISKAAVAAEIIHG